PRLGLHLRGAGLAGHRLGLLGRGRLGGRRLDGGRRRPRRGGHGRRGRLQRLKRGRGQKARAAGERVPVLRVQVHRALEVPRGLQDLPLAQVDLAAVDEGGDLLGVEPDGLLEQGLRLLQVLAGQVHRAQRGPVVRLARVERAQGVEDDARVVVPALLVHGVADDGHLQHLGAGDGGELREGDLPADPRGDALRRVEGARQVRRVVALLFHRTHRRSLGAQSCRQKLLPYRPFLACCCCCSRSSSKSAASSWLSMAASSSAIFSGEAPGGSFLPLSAFFSVRAGRMARFFPRISLRRLSTSPMVAPSTPSSFSFCWSVLSALGSRAASLPSAPLASWKRDSATSLSTAPPSWPTSVPAAFSIWRLKSATRLVICCWDCWGTRMSDMTAALLLWLS